MFLKRHPHLNVRKSEDARIQIKSHFQLLEQTFWENLSNKLRNIFNMDETGLRLNNELKIDLEICIFRLGQFDLLHKMLFLFFSKSVITFYFSVCNIINSNVLTYTYIYIYIEYRLYIQDVIIHLKGKNRPSLPCLFNQNSVFKLSRVRINRICFVN